MAEEETQPATTEETPAYREKSVPKPDKAKFDKKVNDVQAEIERLKAKMEAIQAKMNELKGKKGASGPVAEARIKMRELRQKKDVVITARKTLFDQRDKLKAAMDQMKTQASAMRSGMKFNNIDDITKQLKHLEHTHNTTSMSLQEEKVAIKEIETLKSMRTTLAGLTGTKAKMDETGDAKKQIQAAIAEENKKLSAIQEEIEGQKEKLDKLNESDTGKKDIFPALIREKERLSKEVDLQYDEVRTMRIKWREDNNTWYEAAKIARVERDKRYKEESERRQKEWEAKQEEIEAEEAKKEPYEEEKLLCDYLLKYLATTYSGGAKTETKAAAFSGELEGMVPMGKKYADEEEYLTFGKKKSGKSKQKAGKSKKKISHSTDTINTFGIVGVLPPNTVGAVDDTVAAIKAKWEWYKTAPRPEKKKKEAKDESAPKPKKEKTNQKVPDLASFPGLGGAPAAAAAAPAAKAAPAAAAAAAPAAAPAAAKAAPAAAADDEQADPHKTKKEIPAEKLTYCDHPGFNKLLPDLSGLEMIQGEALEAGKGCVIFFWGKYAKGDYRTICDFSALALKYPEVQMLGISCDPGKDAAEALLGKANKPMPEQNIPEFKIEGLKMGWDNGKKITAEFKKICAKTMCGPGDCFIFNPANKCLWLENFSGSWAMAQGQFAEQVVCFKRGVNFITNGPRPVLPGDEDIEEECDMGDGATDYVDAFDDEGDGDY